MSKTRFASSPVGVTATALAVLTIMVSGCATTPRETSVTDANRVASAKARPTAGCVNDTGSRIQRKDEQGKPDECRGPGRTYTQEDLQRTGDFNAADALRRLDPSIQ
jgi:hypothetical protein